MYSFLLLAALIAVANCQEMTSVPDVVCNAESMTIRASFESGFNGRVYPKGLSKQQNCSMDGTGGNDIEFEVNLFGCATILANPEAVDSQEYTNIIVFQRHPMLVTGSDLAYRVHCNYELGEKTVASDVTVDMVSTTILPSAAPLLPDCFLRIKLGSSPDDPIVTTSVSLGTPLTFVIEMGASEVYGFTVNTCFAHDGMDMMRMMIIDEEGCATDPDIFGELIYDPDNFRVYTPFAAHKFPTANQVYYQCNVKLCLHDQCEAPVCPAGGRKKRQALAGNIKNDEEPELIVRDVLIIGDFDDNEVYANEDGVVPLSQLPSTTVVKNPDTQDKICMNTVAFALAIALFAGIFLLSTVISAFLCARSRSRKGSEFSSTYDNPSYQ